MIEIQHYKNIYKEQIQTVCKSITQQNYIFETYPYKSIYLTCHLHCVINAKYITQSCLNLKFKVF